LGRRVRRAGRWTRVDSEGRARVGDVVVGRHPGRSEGGADVISGRTSILTGYTTVSGGDAIGGNKAASTARSQPNRIGITIGLAVRVRCPGRVALVDSEGRARVGDVVVGKHPGRSEGGADVISGRTSILTGYTTVSGGDAIGGNKAASTARSQPNRIGITIGLAVRVRCPGRVALVDSEGRARVGDVVVGKHPGRSEGGADVISGRTSILTGYTTVSGGDAIGGNKAASTARSQPNRIGITIGLAVRVRCPGRVALVDSEGRARVGDVVVGKHPGRSEGGADVISGRTSILTGYTTVSGGDAIGGNKAASTARSQPNRIGITIGLAVRVRCPGRVALVDSEGRARVGDVVVGKHPGRSEGGADVISGRTSILTGYTTVSGGDAIGGNKAASTARSQPNRIGITIGLAVRVRCPGRVALVDSEGRARVGDVVVGKHPGRSEGGADVISGRTSILTGYTTVSGGDAIGGNKAASTARSQPNRIGITIGLAVRVRCPGRVALVDSEGRARVGDVVVGKHPGRSEGGADVISGRTSILTGYTTVSGGDAIGGNKAASTARSQPNRIGITIGLAVRVRCPGRVALVDSEGRARVGDVVVGKHPGRSEGGADVISGRTSILTGYTTVSGGDAIGGNKAASTARSQPNRIGITIGLAVRVRCPGRVALVDSEGRARVGDVVVGKHPGRSEGGADVISGRTSILTGYTTVSGGDAIGGNKAASTARSQPNRIGITIGLAVRVRCPGRVALVDSEGRARVGDVVVGKHPGRSEGGADVISGRTSILTGYTTVSGGDAIGGNKAASTARSQPNRIGITIGLAVRVRCPGRVALVDSEGRARVGDVVVGKHPGRSEGGADVISGRTSILTGYTTVSGGDAIGGNKAASTARSQPNRIGITIGLAVRVRCPGRVALVDSEGRARVGDVVVGKHPGRSEGGADVISGRTSILTGYTTVSGGDAIGGNKAASTARSQPNRIGITIGLAVRVRCPGRVALVDSEGRARVGDVVVGKHPGRSEGGADVISGRTSILTGYTTVSGGDAIGGNKAASTARSQPNRIGITIGLAVRVRCPGRVALVDSEGRARVGDVVVGKHPGRSEGGADVISGRTSILTGYTTVSGGDAIGGNKAASTARSQPNRIGITIGLAVRVRCPGRVALVDSEGRARVGDVVVGKHPGRSEGGADVISGRTSILTGYTTVSGGDAIGGNKAASTARSQPNRIGITIGLAVRVRCPGRVALVDSEGRARVGDVVVGKHPGRSEGGADVISGRTSILTGYTTVSGGDAIGGNKAASTARSQPNRIGITIGLAVRVRCPGRVALVDSEGRARVGDVVVGKHPGRSEGGADVISGRTSILTGYTTVSGGDAIGGNKAASTARSQPNRIGITIGLAVRVRCPGRVALVDSEGRARVGDVVVGKHPGRSEGGADVISGRTSILTGYTTVSGGDAIGGNKAASTARSQPNRIGITIGLAVRVRCPGRVALVDSEGRARVGDVVVGKHPGRSEGGADVISGRTSILTGYTTVSGGDAIGGNKAASTARSQPNRIGITIGLAVRVRCPGRVALVDSEGRARVGDVVVGKHPGRSEGGADVISGRTSILTGYTTVSGGDAIGGNKAASTARSQPNRIGITIGLAVRVRCPGRVALVDSEGRARVGDVVVGKHPGRSEGGADVISGRTSILTGYTTVSGGDAIGGNKAAST